MADTTVSLILSIQGDQVVVKGLDGIQQKIGTLDKQAKTGGQNLSFLFAGLLPAITAGVVVKFFSDCVKLAEQENESLRRLKGVVEAYGQSWSSAEPAIKAFADTQEKNTRFGKTETYALIEKLTLQLKDYKQAILLANVAQNASVKSGKDLSEVMSVFNMAIANPQRGMMLLRRTFGGLIGDAKDVSTAFNNLNKNTDEAATKEDSLTKSQKNLINNFQEMQKMMGQGLIPVWKAVIDGLGYVIKGFEHAGITINSFFSVVLNGFDTMGNIAMALYEGKFSKIPGIIKASTDTVKQIYEKQGEDLLKIWDDTAGKEQNISKQKLDLKLKNLKQEDKEIKFQAEEEKKVAEMKQKQVDADSKAIIEEWNKRVEAIAKLNEGLATSIGDAMGQMAAGSKNAYKVMLKAALDYVKQMLIIDLASASGLTLAQQGPIGLFELGAITAAFAGISAGIDAIPAMQQGGLIKGSAKGTVIRAGENYKPEIIVPLDKTVGQLPPIIIQCLDPSGVKQADVDRIMKWVEKGTTKLKKYQGY